MNLCEEEKEVRAAEGSLLPLGVHNLSQRKEQGPERTEQEL